MKIGELIEKYELKLKVVTELIQKSEQRKDIEKELAVRRFLIEFIFDLRDLASYEYKNKHQDFDCEDDADN